LAFLLAVGQLRAAIEGGRGFEDELRTVQAMAPADLDVAELTADFSGYATAGVPTLTSLQQSFVPLGAKVIRSTALPEEGESWWNRTVDRLLTVITIRRIDGEAVGTGPAAVVSRAEALLNTGALAEAVGEMSALTGAAAEVANAWVTQAQARLAADKTLNGLTGTALAAVTASQTPAEPGKEG
jgi:uroporphyrinogen-III synthase